MMRMDSLPTQLYVSMVAPNEKIYREYIRPSNPATWKKYLRSLEVLKEAGKKCRTVLRMTIARGINDSDLEGYAQQIKTAKPHYVEVKSMVFVGGARKPERGLGLGSMMAVDEIKKIAGALADATGYSLADVHGPSRVALLCRDQKTWEGRKILWK
jgi:tRNA wybutosine-synthesizing protein 1